MNKIGNFFNNIKSHFFGPSSDGSFITSLSRLFKIRTKTEPESHINDGYGCNSDVYSIISRIAETGSSIPLKLVIDNQGEIEDVTEGELFERLKMPNPEQTQKEFLEEAFTYLLASGNVFTFAEEPIGMPTSKSLRILPTQFITPRVHTFVPFPITTAYQFNGFGKEKIIPAEEIRQVKYINPTTLGIESGYGLSPLQAGWITLTGSSGLKEADAAIVKNQGTSGIVSSGSNTPMSPEDAQKMQGRWDQHNSGPETRGKVLFTTAALSYIQMGMSPADLKLIESGVFKLRDLCNIFSCDSSLFNDPANKTFNNRKEALKDFYINAVLPDLGRIVNSIYNQWYLIPWRIRDGKNYQLQLDTSGIEVLHEDKFMLSQKVIQEIAMGVISRNEGRVILGHGLSEEEAMDEIIVMNNLEPLSLTVSKDENTV